MDLAAVVTIALVAAALLGIWLLPLGKRWNDDGAADEARQAVERELVAGPVAHDWVAPDARAGDDASEAP